MKTQTTTLTWDVFVTPLELEVAVGDDLPPGSNTGRGRRSRPR